MTTNSITVQAKIDADRQKVWEYYTQPKHIIQWNFAHESWHCPSASNDMRPGGKYLVRMEARDGSFGFDFEATYDEVTEYSKIAYTMTDGRQAIISFDRKDDSTEVSITFDAENENPIDMQRDGWQAILNNFKKYVENQ